jgi:hypothetical protein
MFLDGAHDAAALERLEGELYPLWELAASKHGLSMNRAHGVRVERSSGASSDYVTKFGRGPRWDVVAELTKGHLKLGRSLVGRQQFTAWELLALSGSGDTRAGVLFREFVEHFSGRAQLYWSPGLAALLLPDVPQLDDAELAVVAESDAVEVGTIPPPVWESVLRAHGRARVLELVEAAGGGWGLAASYIEEVCRRYPPYQRRDLLAVSPELRAQLGQLHAEQRERNRWRGPLSPAGEVC